MTATAIETSDQLADLTDMIRECASSVGYRFRGFVDTDDLSQEGWLWALENRAEIDALLHAGQPFLVRHKLSRAMQRYARRERAAWLGTSVDDEFSYSVQMLREVLPLLLASDGTPSPLPIEDRTASGKSNVAEGGTLQAVWCDVRAAFNALPDDDRFIVWRTYVDEAPSHVIGEEVGLSGPAVRSRVTRALRRMQKRLGGPKP